MSNIRRLTWEESEDFASFLVRAGYRIEIDMSKHFGDVCYKMVLSDMLGEVLASSSIDYDIDISTLIIRCLDNYITTSDGKEMVMIWEQ